MIQDTFNSHSSGTVPRFCCHEQYIDALAEIDRQWATEVMKTREQSPYFHELIDRVVLYETENATTHTELGK